MILFSNIGFSLWNYIVEGFFDVVERKSLQLRFKIEDVIFTILKLRILKK